MSLNNSVDWSTGEYAAVDEADEINVLSAEEYCAMAKRVGLEIDPATAEIHFSYVQVTDPYGVFPLHPTSSIVSGVSGSLVHPTATFGCVSTTCQKRHG